MIYSSLLLFSLFQPHILQLPNPLYNNLFLFSRALLSSFSYNVCLSESQIKNCSGIITRCLRINGCSLLRSATRRRKPTSSLAKTTETRNKKLTVPYFTFLRVCPKTVRLRKTKKHSIGSVALKAGFRYNFLNPRSLTYDSRKNSGQQ